MKSAGLLQLPSSRAQKSSARGTAKGEVREPVEGARIGWRKRLIRCAEQRSEAEPAAQLKPRQSLRHMYQIHQPMLAVLSEAV